MKSCSRRKKEDSIENSYAKTSRSNFPYYLSCYTHQLKKTLNWFGHIVHKDNASFINMSYNNDITNKTSIR